MSEFIPKKELELMFKAVDTRIETYHRETMEVLRGHTDTHDKMLAEQKYTNGKVKKIIMVLIGISFFSLGLGLKELSPLLKLLL